VCRKVIKVQRNSRPRAIPNSYTSGDPTRIMEDSNGYFRKITIGILIAVICAGSAWVWRIDRDALEVRMKVQTLEGIEVPPRWFLQSVELLATQVGKNSEILSEVRGCVQRIEMKLGTNHR